MKSKLLISLLPCLILWSPSAQAKTWAAQFPYGSGELSPVFHARSSDSVLAKAKQFCKANELCSSQYGDEQIAAVAALGAVGFSNLFVTTLCRQENGEHVYVTVPSVYDESAGREDGKQKGQEAIRSAGHSADDCVVHAVFGVKSRERLKADLTAQPAKPVSQSLKGEIRLYRIQRRNATRMAVEIMD
jgi:hypothetical protein